MPVLLSKSRGEANKQNIQYLFGQLAIAHKGMIASAIATGFEINDVRYKYDGSKWTDDPTTIANLFYLSKIFGSNIYLLKNPKDGSTFVSLNTKSYIPTISPKDPKFEEWYKNEYEPRMKDWKKPEV